MIKVCDRVTEPRNYFFFYFIRCSSDEKHTVLHIPRFLDLKKSCVEEFNIYCEAFFMAVHKKNILSGFFLAVRLRCFSLLLIEKNNKVFLFQGT
jgi:hypothetical protein